MATLVLPLCDVVHRAAARRVHMRFVKIHCFVATVRIRIAYSLTTRRKCTTRDLTITMSDTRPHRLPFPDGAVRLSVDCKGLYFVARESCGRETLPETFKKHFPKARYIIECLKILINTLHHLKPEHKHILTIRR